MLCVVCVQVSLDGFRNKRFNCLVATDVAGRGIDIPVLNQRLFNSLPVFPSESILADVLNFSVLVEYVYLRVLIEMDNLGLSIPIVVLVQSLLILNSGHVMFLQDVAHVINYDMPGNIEMYTHRIGKFSCP